ncbi:hypothetical protein K9M06_04930 [Candidatus Bipolaricaulota bacterium]|nr:hypothetical protein [Candidatus Bipolaricaulota bacterium]
MFVTVYTPDIPLYGQEEGVWVLTEVIDRDGEERNRKFNEEHEELHYEVNYSRGSFTQRRTYTGPTESMHPYSDAVHGESTTHKASGAVRPK